MGAFSPFVEGYRYLLHIIFCTNSEGILLARSYLNTNMATKKNSLVANINKRKKKGISRKKKNTTISKKAYTDLQNNWGESTPKNKKDKK